VRFIGGSIAPYLAGRLAEVFSPHVPFFFGAAMVLTALVVLFLGRRQLGAVDAPETTMQHQQVIVEELEAAAGA
jgi:fucose permease